MFADLPPSSKSIAKLSDGDRVALHNGLDALTGQVWDDRALFLPELRKALRSAGIDKPSTPLVKSIWSTIGEHDDTAKICTTPKGEVEPDPSLRDTENVPLTVDIQDYFEREVLPHVPNAWIDHDKTKIGYEIPFTRHFYVYTPPRPLAEIDAELRDLESQIQKLLGEVTG